MDTLHFSGVLDESNNKLWGFHVVVPAMIAQTLLSNDAKRVVCTLNTIQTFQCGLIPKGDQEYCIMVNKKIRDLLGLKAGSVVQVQLKKDESEYGLPMPEEMAELLAQDEEASRLFHALTPGKMRTLLYIIGNVKNSDGRIFRAIAITEHLKANMGKVDYRKLNDDLRAGKG